MIVSREIGRLFGQNTRAAHLFEVNVLNKEEPSKGETKSKTNNKKQARLNCISHLLNNIPYQELKREPVKLPKRDRQHAYDDDATLASRTFVPRRF